jgi:hypothetical protein
MLTSSSDRLSQLPLQPTRMDYRLARSRGIVPRVVATGPTGRAVMAMMTLEQIDDALADWDNKLQLASDNLMALTCLTAYQRLKGEGGWPRAQVTGDTAARALPALEGMQELWSHYSLFHDVVQRAKDLRNSLSMLLPSRGTLAEIERLLRGPSIKLPPVATLLEQRGLLTASEVSESVTPERLLGVMNHLFQQARDAVTAVDAAWNRLPEIVAQHETELSELEAAASSLGDGVVAELASARRCLTALKEMADTDPLAAVGRCDDLMPILRAARSRLDEQVKDRDGVRAEMVAARDLLKGMDKAQRQAREACAECMVKVHLDGDALPTPPDDAPALELEAWLAKLEATIAEGKYRPARIGLERWMATAKQHLATAEDARRAGERLLRERRDLRGLLDALRAKASACGRSEDGELAALMNEAWLLLHSRPTPLPRARHLVAEYQKRLL